MEYINKNFYCVKLDAETHDTLHYKGKSFYFRPEYKANELAVLLLNGRMAYPTAVYMESDLDLITPVAGYQSPEQLLSFLHFIGDNVSMNKSWDEYQAGRK